MSASISSKLKVQNNPTYGICGEIDFYSKDLIKKQTLLNLSNKMQKNIQYFVPFVV